MLRQGIRRPILAFQCGNTAYRMLTATITWNHMWDFLIWSDKIKIQPSFSAACNQRKHSAQVLDKLHPSQQCCFQQYQVRTIHLKVQAETNFTAQIDTGKRASTCQPPQLIPSNASTRSAGMTSIAWCCMASKEQGAPYSEAPASTTMLPLGILVHGVSHRMKLRISRCDRVCGRVCDLIAHP